MPFYVIKNNMKLMFRNKWLIVILVLSPIIIIAVISSTFEDMMKKYEAPDTFRVGYSLNQNSEFMEYMDRIKQYGKDAGLIFVEYPEGNCKDVLTKNEDRSFVEFGETNYTIYQLENYKVEGMITEYFMDRFMKNAFFPDVQGLEENISIKEVTLDYIPSVEAKDYYGMIEIVYFLWQCFVSFAFVLSDEKKYGIRKKYEVSPISGVKLYLANIASCMLVTAFEMGITIAVVTKIYEIKWGNPPFTILLLFLTALGGIAFGLFLTYLFDNLAITVIFTFTLAWVAGFFGGTFETYMLSSWPEWVKALSPIYHVNRALVEFSSVGSSKYMGSAVIYLLLISVFSILAGTALTKVVRRNV